MTTEQKEFGDLIKTFKVDVSLDTILKEFNLYGQSNNVSKAFIQISAVLYSFYAKRILAVSNQNEEIVNLSLANKNFLKHGIKLNL